MKTFVVTVLNSEVKNFLREYVPLDKHFTSEKEISLVEKILGLNTLTREELDAVRNTVVMYYEYLMDTEYNVGGRSDTYFNLMLALQSVTAVIDNYIFTKL